MVALWREQPPHNSCRQGRTGQQGDEIAPRPEHKTHASAAGTHRPARPTDPRVTVLLPVFNGGATLAQAIESILAQDYDNFELLVIDDCSNDSTAELLSRFAASDGRVRPVRHETNIGLVGTLNEGLRVAAGEFVARMDHDDIALSDRLSVQVAFLERNPGVAVVGSWVYHLGAEPSLDRLVRLPTGPEEVARALGSRNCLYHSSVLMRRAEILDLGGYRAAFLNSEDYDLWLRVSRSHRIANVRQPLLRYRFSIGGATIGRKWEQLYFTALAQSAAQRGVSSMEDAEVIARGMLEFIDRRRFLSAVARDTADELFALGFLNDARTVVLRHWRELGPAWTSRLMAGISLRAALIRVAEAQRAVARKLRAR
jgi:glycosyltransferase involved in cell wall biosynthesis